MGLAMGRSDRLEYRIDSLEAAHGSTSKRPVARSPRSERPSEIARLAAASPLRTVERMSSPGRRSNDRHLDAMGGQLVAALRAADGPGAEAVVTEALNAGIAPTAIQVDLISKGMVRIGDLWEQGDVTIADEHVATGLCDRALLALQGPLQVAPPRSRERIVLAAVEGQTHVLGLQMVADVLGGAGYEVLNLGADVPSASLHAFVAEHMPAIVGLSSTQVGDAPRLAGAIVAVHDALRSTRIMLGGNGVPLEWRNAPYPWVSNTLAVLDVVERLLEGPPLEPPAAIVELNADLIASPPQDGCGERADG